jgi:hypothetical protein
MKVLMRLLTVCLALLLMAATSEAQRGGGGGHGGGGFHAGGGGFHGGMGGFHGGAAMPGFRPGFNPGSRPGFNPGFRPGFNHGFRPGSNPGFRPGFDRGHRDFDRRSVVISPFFGSPFYSTPIVPFDSESIYTGPTYITPDPTTQSSGDQTSDDLNLQVQQLTNEVQQLQAELGAARGQSTEAPGTAQKAPPVTLILKDGRRIEAQGYASVGSTLWILNPGQDTKISLSDVDVDATQKENLKRGRNVVIPQPSS